MNKLITITLLALTLNTYSQKLQREYYDWAKTKIKREYYTDNYGKLNGPYKAFSEYGGILKQGQCKDDGPIGKWIENYPDGKLHFIKYYDVPGTYNFQVIDGKIISYYEDGKTIKYERNFKNMELDGVWKEYDVKGIITKEGKYVNGIFEPTGITKIKFEEEQKKQKQLEEEALLKKKEEYNKIIPEADKAFSSNNYNKSLDLYIKASELLIEEIYPKDKVNEILEIYKSDFIFLKNYYKNQYDSLNLDKIYFSSNISTFKKKYDENYGWLLSKDGKTTIVTLNGCPAEKFNWEKPWETCCLGNPSFEDFSSSISWKYIINCVNNNKHIYSPIQNLVTNEYFKLDSLLQTEKEIIRKSKTTFDYNGMNYNYYSYDKNNLIELIERSKSDYNYLKRLIAIEAKCNEKKSLIESLNNSNKKKILFSKYQIIW